MIVPDHPENYTVRRTTPDDDAQMPFVMIHPDGRRTYALVEDALWQVARCEVRIDGLIASL